MRFFICLLIFTSFIPILNALTLSEAYTKAILNDGRVKGYSYNVEAMKEGTEQAKSKFYPSLNASAKVGKRRYSPRYIEETRKEQTSDVSVNLVQPLYHPEYLSEFDKSKLEVEVSELKYIKEKFTLGKEVASAFFEVKRSQSSVKLSRSYLEANEAKHKQIKRTHSFGLSSKVDLLEAKVNFDRARIEFIREKNHLKVSLISLSKIMGEDVKSLSQNNIDPWSIENLFQYDYNYWKARLRNNVDLMLSKQNVDVVKQNLKTQKYGHYPKVDVKLSYAKTESTDIYTYYDDARADIEVKIPIFQGFYVDSRIKEARLLLLAANQEVAHFRRISNLTFEEEWEKYMAAYESVTVLREAVDSAKAYMTYIEKSHAKGLKSLFDYYDAKAKLFQVNRDLVNAIFDIATAYTSLLEVTGELTIERYEELDTMLTNIK